MAHAVIWSDESIVVGTHALVVGVGEYPHLAGGAAPATANAGQAAANNARQLPASAPSGSTAGAAPAARPGAPPRTVLPRR